MKKTTLLYMLYSLLLLCGGAAGYFVAHSVPSLLISLGTSIALLITAFFIQKGNSYAYKIGQVLLVALLLLFAYRSLSTGKMIPAGLWLLTFVFFILIRQSQQQHLRTCSKSSIG